MSRVGHLLTYLTKLPLLGAACGGRLAYLSALLEATVVGHLEEASPAGSSAHVHTYVRMYIHTYTRTYIRTHVHTYVRMYMCSDTLECDVYQFALYHGVHNLA